MNKRLLQSNTNTIREFALGDAKEDHPGDNHENNDAKMNDNSQPNSPYQTVTANTPIDKTLYWRFENSMYFVNFILCPIIYFFDGRSRSRHKQSVFN